MARRKTPRGFRLHIGIFGRRNVGKSSLLNMVTRQNTSIVSEHAGTTTDPVNKPMEMLPLGPVLFIDTAGIDDIGALGELRVQKTRKVFDRTDLGVIVSSDGVWGNFEEQIIEEFNRRGTPIVVVFNKTDLHTPDENLVRELKAKGLFIVETCATELQGKEDFRSALVAAAPEEFKKDPVIIRDLVGPGDTVVMVVPIDKEAPKGRIILPQVQTLRELLDNDSITVVVKESQLESAIANLKNPPKLVVTDSQAFAEVSPKTPEHVLMTGFSVLFARLKGDLRSMVLGAASVDNLKPGDNVLVAETCSHHPITDDIGTEKIPRWLNKYVGGELNFSHVQGHDFPDDLSPYKLVIHCGACMWNRKEMMSRIMHCQEAGVPITNYGLVIAFSLGIFERALGPFPEILSEYLEMRGK